MLNPATQYFCNFNYLLMNTKRNLKFEIRDKNRWTLVKIEIVALSILSSIWVGKKYSWDLITGIIACIIIMITSGALFFKLRAFRYIFTILFSIFWGFLCYVFVHSASISSYTPWVGFVLALLISLYLHKDFFDFES
jgi:hypothetical protein